MASWQDAPPVDQEAQQQPTWMTAPPVEQEVQKPAWMSAPPAEDSAWSKAPPAQQDSNKPGFFSPVLPTFSGKDWLGAGEAAANMVGSMPGIGAGGLSAAGYGAMSLPNAVGLPGPFGENSKNIGSVYHAAEDWVNNHLGGVGAQYKPGTPEGKAFVQELSKSIEAAMGHVDSWIRTGGKFVGAPDQVTDLAATTAKIGEEFLLTVGVPELGVRGLKAMRPETHAPVYLPTEKGGVVSHVNAALDAVDAAAATKARTQGEGTIHVGPDGTATVGEMPVIKETGEQVDIARTAQQNELQKRAVGEQGEPTDLFPSEKGKAHEQKAQSLDMLADSAEKAEKPELAAAYRAQAEAERSLAKQYSDAPRQGNLDLQTEPNRSEGTQGNASQAIPENHTHQVVDTRTGEVVATYQSLSNALKGADRLDNQHGGTRYRAERIPEKLEGTQGNASERPPYGEPGSLDRLKFMIWETAQALAEKRAKLAALEGRDPNSINWGRDWEPDTPVRSLKDARDEIQMLEDRQVSRHEKLEGTPSPDTGIIGQDLTTPIGGKVAPESMPLYKHVVEFIKNLAISAKEMEARLYSERSRRTNQSFDEHLQTKIPLEIDGRSIIQPDGSIHFTDLITAMGRATTNHPAARGMLLKVLEQLAPYLYDVKIKWEGADLVGDYLGKDGKTYAKDKAGKVVPNSSYGVYFSGEHQINFGTKGANLKTMVHELVHAATVRAIDAHVHTVTGKLRDPATTPKAIKDLLDIFNAFRGMGRIHEYQLFNPSTGKMEMKTGLFVNGTKFYGLENVKEFASEVLVNRYLQHALSETKMTGASKGPNMLKKAYDAIKDLLGIKGDNTLLNHAVFAIENVMEFQKTNLPEITAAIKNIFDKSVHVRDLIVEAGGNPHTSDHMSEVRTATPETVAADKMSEVAGEHYIPKAPEITPELVAKIAAEADSGAGKWAGTKKNLTPGMLAAAQLTGSTMFKTIYQLMNSAYKKAEYKIHAHVKPVQEAFVSIMKNAETAALSHSILMREMRNGKEYGAAELRAAGVPDKVIMAHLQFRNMMDIALESQNAQLRAKGLPEIKAIDAYVSSRWSGPYRANVRNADGDIVFQIAEHSKRQAEAAVAHLKEKNPDLKFEDVEYRHGHEKGADIDAGYLDMLKMLDPNDPRLPALKSAYEDFVMGRTEDVAGQEKHFQAKKGVGGYAGDRPWSKTDVQDFFVQQFAYAENAFKWAEHQKSMEGVNKLLNDPSLAESQKNNIRQSREYVKSQLGFGTAKVFDALDNALAKAFGVSTSTLQSYMGASKTLFYLSKLGLSIPFTIIQFIQPAITTPAFHAMLDSQGFKHNPVLSTYKAITGGSQAALWHYGQFFQVPALTRLAEEMMSGLDKQAARYMEANGIIDINPMTDIKKGLRPTAVKMLAAPFEFTIKHSEVIARSWAFMGFVDHLKQSGKFDLKSEKGRLDLFQKAEDMTNLSMTDYRSQERAQIFEKGGLTGDAAATLHAYQLNNLMQVVNFTKMARQGNVKPLFYMVAMQALAGGLTGLWFIDDIDDMLNNIKKLLPHDQYMQVKDFSVKNFIVDNVKTAVKSGTSSFTDPKTQGKLADAANYGVMSAATGTNIHTRASAANQIPVWPFESQEDPIKNAAGLVPFAETTLDTGMGIAAAVNPDNTNKERLAGAYKAAPAVAQGPMENLPGFSQNGVSLRTKDLSQGKYRRTEAEQSLRNYGLRSTAEQEHSTKEFELSKVERELQRRVQNESAKATDFFVEGDSKRGVEHAIKYIELGGDPQTLFNGIPKAKLDLVTTELERRAIQAQGQSKATIMKLQRYLNLVGR